MVRGRTFGLWVLVALAVAQPIATVFAKDEPPPKLDPAVIRSRVAELAKRQADWERVMHKRGIPGMAITVVLGDDVIFSRTLGQRDPVKGLPVTDDTMFYIASCTKSYVAMAIMTLVDEGKVALDAPVKKYLPRFELADKEATKKITIRDLLSHAKGLNSTPAVILDAYTGEITEDRYYYWLKKAKPKGAFEYTNVHYTLLGRVIEAVTGESWRDYLQERIFKPAGMYHTTGYASRLYGSDDHAVPCYHNGTRVEPCRIRKTDRTMHAAGGLGTTLNDLSRWLRLNLNGGVIDGRRIVSKASIGAMQKLQCQHGMESPTPGMTRDGYGFGWFVGTLYGHRLLEHGGGYLGTAAEVSFMPDMDLGVAVVANGSSSLTFVVASEIYATLLGQERSDKLEHLEKACEPYFERMRAWQKEIADNPVDKDVLSLPLDRYVGRYYNEHWGDVVVGQSDGTMTIQFGDIPLRLESTDKDKMKIYLDPGTGQPAWFELTDEGQVAAFAFSGPEGVEVRFARRGGGPS